VSPSRQIETELPAGAGVAISGSIELERGARGALLVERSFRLDVCPIDDTLKLVVRGLGAAEVKSQDGGYSGAVIGREEQLAALRGMRPSRFDLSLEIVEADTLRRAEILISAIYIPERGVTSLSAQALVRPPADLT
jgi:hypothetical protein